MSSSSEFYRFQAEARGIRSRDDVIRAADAAAYLYDQIVARWLPARKDAPVCDLGCGHGSFLHWLRQKGFDHAAGVDASAEQVALANSAGLKVERADLLDWLKNQPPGSQEALFGVDLIEHLSKDDFVSLLKLSHRALAPGGRLVLRYPNGDSPLVGRNLFNDITHVWTYTTNGLNSLAAMAGFSQAEFVEQAAAAIRDGRWLKVPLSLAARAILRALFKAASREDVRSFSPHMWACLTR